MKSYPSEWPLGYKRTPNPTFSRFKTTFAMARNFVFAELRRLGASNDIVISCSMKLYGEQPKARMKEKGVAVYFKLNDKPVVLCCDNWDQIQDNLYAIGLTIEAMRAMERWGVSNILSRMFSGFEVLPETTEENPYEVLGVSPNASEFEIKNAWKNKILEHHPDKGGDVEEYHRVNKAYDKLKKD
jgi:hypothetical protein